MVPVVVLVNARSKNESRTNTSSLSILLLLISDRVPVSIHPDVVGSTPVSSVPLLYHVRGYVSPVSVLPLFSTTILLNTPVVINFTVMSKNLLVLLAKLPDSDRYNVPVLAPDLIHDDQLNDIYCIEAGRISSIFIPLVEPFQLLYTDILKIPVPLCIKFPVKNDLLIDKSNKIHIVVIVAPSW